MSKKKTALTVRLPQELYRKIKLEAAEQKRSMSQHIVYILEGWYEDVDAWKEAEEKFKQGHE